MADPCRKLSLVARSGLGLGAPALLLLAGLTMAGPLQAGPVLCTTTLEAPPVGADRRYDAPVEVSRCGPVQTLPELAQRRFYTYTAPFAPGVSLLHQITDALGLAMGGEQGNRLVAFGFPDQTVVWDATALGNTTARLLEDQSQTMPLRTADLPSMFTTSLGYGVGPAASLGATMAPRRSDGWMTPVRGLW